MTDAYRALQSACLAIGLDHRGARLIRSSENTIFQLPGRIVARVSRPGQLAAARKEIAVSRWLMSLDVPVVEALPDIDQPIACDSRAVTFWQVTFALQMATERPDLAEQAQYRLRCIQGRRGSRPWHWVGIP